MRERPVDDLVERVLHSLEIAERVVHTLLDAAPAIDLAALEAQQDKVLAETALLLRAVASIPGSVSPSLSDRAHRLAVTLRPHASGLRIQAGIALHPSLALDYALAHQCLSALGYPDPKVDALLKKAMSSANANGRERLPHRHLEQTWIDQLTARQAAAVPTASTALGQGVDVLTGSRDDLYALTHAILYATDLGSRQCAMPRTVSTVCHEAASALAGSLDDDDFDLAGELLMAWPMLRAPWSPSARFGVDVLFAIEDEVGLLPSLAIDGRNLNAQSGRARNESALAMSYHTAYVMGLLCASLLRWGSAVGRFAEPRPVLLDVALSALRELQREPRWEDHFMRLPIEEREELAPFVLDVALRRSVRRFEFGIAQRLVLAAVDQGVCTCAVTQAAELLDRLSAIDWHSA